MRTVRFKEKVYHLSTFPLIVIHLEWSTFCLVRCVIRFVSEALFRISKNVSMIMRVGLPGRVKDRGVRLVNNYTHIRFDLGHNEIKDNCIKIIDTTDINELTSREWHVNSFIPQELNQRDFF